MHATAIFSKKRWQVRNIFLFPREFYSLRDASKRLGLAPGVLRRDIETGRFQAYRNSDGEWRLTWRQLVSVALSRWTLAEIETALGDDTLAILPELARSQTLELTLPKYVIAMLTVLAAEANGDVSSALVRLLEPIAREGAERFETAAPGFASAVFFPHEGAEDRR